MMKDGMGQMKEWATTMKAGAVASANEMMETVKEKAEDMVESAKETIHEKTA